jgi:hypothetical protein
MHTSAYSSHLIFCLGIRWDMLWVWVAVGRLDIIKSSELRDYYLRTYE